MQRGRRAEDLVSAFYSCVAPHTKQKGPWLVYFEPDRTYKIELTIKPLHEGSVISTSSKTFTAKGRDEDQAKEAVSLQVLQYLETQGILPNDWWRWPEGWRGSSERGVLRFFMLCYLLILKEHSWVAKRNVVRYNISGNIRSMAMQILEQMITDGVVVENHQQQVRLATMQEYNTFQQAHNKQQAQQQQQPLWPGRSGSREQVRDVPVRQLGHQSDRISSRDKPQGPPLLHSHQQLQQRDAPYYANDTFPNLEQHYAADQYGPCSMQHGLQVPPVQRHAAPPPLQQHTAGLLAADSYPLPGPAVRYPLPQHRRAPTAADHHGWPPQQQHAPPFAAAPVGHCTPQLQVPRFGAPAAGPPPPLQFRGRQEPPFHLQHEPPALWLPRLGPHHMSHGHRDGPPGPYAMGRDERMSPTAGFAQQGRDVFDARAPWSGRELREHAQRMDDAPYVQPLHGPPHHHSTEQRPPLNRQDAAAYAQPLHGPSNQRRDELVPPAHRQEPPGYLHRPEEPPFQPQQRRGPQKRQYDLDSRLGLTSKRSLDDGPGSQYNGQGAAAAAGPYSRPPGNLVGSRSGLRRDLAVEHGHLVTSPRRPFEQPLTARAQQQQQQQQQQQPPYSPRGFADPQLSPTRGMPAHWRQGPLPAPPVSPKALRIQRQQQQPYSPRGFFEPHLSPRAIRAQRQQQQPYQPPSDRQCGSFSLPPPSAAAAASSQDGYRRESPQPRWVEHRRPVQPALLHHHQQQQQQLPRHQQDPFMWEEGVAQADLHHESTVHFASSAPAPALLQGRHQLHHNAQPHADLVGATLHGSGESGRLRRYDSGLSAGAADLRQQQRSGREGATAGWSGAEGGGRNSRSRLELRGQAGPKRGRGSSSAVRQQHEERGRDEGVKQQQQQQQSRNSIGERDGSSLVPTPSRGRGSVDQQEQKHHRDMSRHETGVAQHGQSSKGRDKDWAAMQQQERRSSQDWGGVEAAQQQQRQDQERDRGRGGGAQQRHASEANKDQSRSERRRHHSTTPEGHSKQHDRGSNKSSEKSKDEMHDGNKRESTERLNTADAGNSEARHSQQKRRYAGSEHHSGSKTSQNASHREGSTDRRERRDRVQDRDSARAKRQRVQQIAGDPAEAMTHLPEAVAAASDIALLEAKAGADAAAVAGNRQHSAAITTDNTAASATATAVCPEVPKVLLSQQQLAAAVLQYLRIAAPMFVELQKLQAHFAAAVDASNSIDAALHSLCSTGEAEVVVLKEGWGERQCARACRNRWSQLLYTHRYRVQQRASDAAQEQPQQQLQEGLPQTLDEDAAMQDAVVAEAAACGQAGRLGSEAQQLHEQQHGAAAAELAMQHVMGGSSAAAAAELAMQDVTRCSSAAHAASGHLNMHHEEQRDRGAGADSMAESATDGTNKLSDRQVGMQKQQLTQPDSAATAADSLMQDTPAASDHPIVGHHQKQQSGESGSAPLIDDAADRAAAAAVIGQAHDATTAAVAAADGSAGAVQVPSAVQVPGSETVRNETQQHGVTAGMLQNEALAAAAADTPVGVHGLGVGAVLPSVVPMASACCKEAHIAGAAACGSTPMQRAAAAAQSTSEHGLPGAAVRALDAAQHAAHVVVVLPNAATIAAVAAAEEVVHQYSRRSSSGGDATGLTPTTAAARQCDVALPAADATAGTTVTPAAATPLDGTLPASTTQQAAAVGMSDDESLATPECDESIAKADFGQACAAGDVHALDS